MQAPRALDLLRKQARAMWSSRRRRVALSAVILLLLCSLGLAAAALHQRQATELLSEGGDIEMEVEARGGWQPPAPPPAPPEPPVRAVQADIDRVEPVGPPRNVTAAWYDVPEDSIAKRRAGQQELTAAHNRLPIGTLVRVTHLSNGRSTLVRITDRGIRDKKIKLDICREAAEELGMVDQGIARVKMEIVREENGSAPAESHTAAPQQ
jgi:rare lipoprotein A